MSWQNSLEALDRILAFLSPASHWITRTRRRWGRRRWRRGRGRGGRTFAAAAAVAPNLSSSHSTQTVARVRHADRSESNNESLDGKRGGRRRGFSFERRWAEEDQSCIRSLCKWSRSKIKIINCDLDHSKDHDLELWSWSFYSKFKIKITKRSRSKIISSDLDHAKD